MKRVHFLGIGGSGASAAAAIAQEQGFKVTGCDLEPQNEFTTQFKPSQLLKDHSPKHLAFHPKGAGSNVDILAVTPAIYSLDPNNPELSEAKRLGIEILTWQQFLGKYLMKDKFVIAVAGTHGKTTTTAMIAKLLEDAGMDPTVELGAIVPWWGTNYRVGKSRYFIVEADEYNDNFLAFHPDISVVTNIEMDHPEYFKDFESYKESFKKFLESTKKTIIANLSDPGVKQTLASHMSSGNTVINYSKHLIEFPLNIPGEFNRSNASAAYQVGLKLGIKPQTIQKSLSSYPGVGRRFEYIGEYRGAKVYSDFGHHPTEIRETMKAAREKFTKSRILLVYQPHMFSRTKALFDDFIKVFREAPADKTYIINIYPSREIDTESVSSRQLVDAVGKKSVVHIGSTDHALEKLKPEIRKGDIVFFMSAGDTDKLAKELVSV
ncbi:MAG: Mur ligase family protein [Patescibacteria group bacterium]